MSSSFMKLKGLIRPDKKNIINTHNKDVHDETINQKNVGSKPHKNIFIVDDNDHIINSDDSKAIHSTSTNLKQKAESPVEKLIKIMEEAEKYDTDDQFRSSIPSSDDFKLKQQNETINPLTNKFNKLDINCEDNKHIQNDFHTNQMLDSSIENGESLKKEASVYELNGDALSRITSEILLLNDYNLEKFPSVLSTYKTNSPGSSNKYNRDSGNGDTDDNSSNISSSNSRMSTDPVISFNRDRTIPDSPLKKENISSTHSLKFSKTTTTFMKEKDNVTSNNNNKIYTIDNLLKKRGINRQRSKTLDTSDLKNATSKMFPSVPKFSSNKPPPVSGKTRSKNVARRLSLSSHDKNKNKSKHSQGGNNSNTNTITSHIVRKIRSNSNSSNSNKSSYISPRTSSGSFTTSDIQQQCDNSNNSTNSNNMVTNSAYSLKRRSSSIVNALSSFVNLRSSSSLSDKGPQLSSNFQQYALTLDDLPAVPEPNKDDESFEKYLFRISNYGKFIGIILTLKNDTYKLNCLNYFLSNYFDFLDDPIDISLRKLLIFLELPKEAQQIDRLLTEFGKIYYKQQRTKYMEKCIWENEHQVYFIIFSLLMLHTDYFNPNNKIKMTKTEFIDLVHNDTYSDGNKLPIEILAYYYDNTISKESPKFDCFLSRDTNAIISFDSIENTKMYSPKDLIKDGCLFNMSKQLKMNKREEDDAGGYILPPTIPLPSALIESNTINTSTSFFSNRPTSNSISSYFSYGNNGGSANNSGINYNSNSTGGYLQDDINIYKKILMDDLRDVSLDKFVNKIYSRNNFALDSEYFQILNNTNASNIVNSSYSNNIYNTLMERNYGNLYDKYLKLLRVSRGGYLRIRKAQLYKLRLPSYEKYHQGDVKKGNDKENSDNNEVENDKDKDAQCYYLKIIQMGDIKEYIEPGSKQSGSLRGRSNSEGNKLFSLGSNSHNNDKFNRWKNKFVIITTCGLIICDKNKSFNIQEPDIVKNQLNGEYNYIIDFKYNKCELLSVYNLFAESVKNNFDYEEENETVANNTGNTNQNNGGHGYSMDDELFINDYKDNVIKNLHGRNINEKNDDDNDDTCKCDVMNMRASQNGEEDNNNQEEGSYNDQDDDYNYLKEFDENTFYIWSQYGKLIWRCENKYERDNWIDSLNLMACIDGCQYEISCIDNTLLSQRKQKFDDRYKEIQENRLETVKLFKEEEKLLNLYRQCVPICLKTRKELIQNIKQLAVKMEWYDFEIKRDTIYMMILKCLIPDKSFKEESRVNGNDDDINDGSNRKDNQEEKIINCYEDASDISDSLSFITFN